MARSWIEWIEQGKYTKPKWDEQDELCWTEEPVDAERIVVTYDCGSLRKPLRWVVAKDGTVDGPDY